MLKKIGNKNLNINKILNNNKELSKKLYICNKTIKIYKKDIILLNNKLEKMKNSYTYSIFNEIEEYNKLYNEIYNKKH